MGNLKNRLMGLHKPGIIFLHIPKTGGSSISAALRKHYRLSRFNVKSEATSQAALKRYRIESSDPGYEEALHQFRLSLVFYEAQKGTRYITGHFWADENLPILKSLGYRILTCLRDPVDRWFSHYFYSRYKEGSHGKIDQDIEEFLESRYAVSFGTMYVRYIGGAREDADYVSASAVNRAVNNLEIFDRIGFLHRMDEFRRFLEADTGFRLRAEHRRRSPADPSFRAKITGSKTLRDAVGKLCAGDREVYEQAMSRFPVNR